MVSKSLRVSDFQLGLVAGLRRASASIERLRLVNGVPSGSVFVRLRSGVLALGRTCTARGPSRRSAITVNRNSKKKGGKRGAVLFRSVARVCSRRECRSIVEADNRERRAFTSRVVLSLPSLIPSSPQPFVDFVFRDVCLRACCKPFAC